MNRWLPMYIIAIILIVAGLIVEVSAFLPRHISQDFTMPSGQDRSPYLWAYLHEGFSLRIEYEEAHGTAVGVRVLNSGQFEVLQARGYTFETVRSSSGPSGKFGFNIEESDTYYIMIIHDPSVDQAVSIAIDVHGVDVPVAALGITSIVGGGILTLVGSKFKKDDTYPWSKVSNESDENELDQR